MSARVLVSFRDRYESFRRAHRRPRLVSVFRPNGECLAGRVRIARTAFSRFLGLLMRSRLARDEGMLLAPGGSIHTFGMRFSIDVVFLDAGFGVKAFCRHVRPWRVSLAPPATAFVLELPAGRLDEIKLNALDRLILRSYEPP